jgi:hypothetical protein
MAPRKSTYAVHSASSKQRQVPWCQHSSLAPLQQDPVSFAFKLYLSLKLCSQRADHKKKDKKNEQI